MEKYSREELTEALRAVSSVIHKCEKAQEKFPGGTSHHTLLRNRLKAMYISKALIEEALRGAEPGGSGEPAAACSPREDPGPFYHGTKADLQPGDLLEPGRRSNFGEGRQANYVYLTATLDAAAWGAELAAGDKPGRIYRVEPTGPFEDDPNLTDKKFPGNPTRSYRTRHPLRVVGEVSDWQGHSPEALQNMRDRLEELRRLGVEAIND